MRPRVVQAAAVSLAFVGCRTAPAVEKPAPVSRAAPEPPPQAQFPAQPGSVIASIDGTDVLALSAPAFASLPRDQRMLAYWTAQAASAGDRVTLEQDYRHNLSVARLLRGILSRPAAVPAALLAKIRPFARIVWLNHGLHDYETGRKVVAPFTAADLRDAALAAQAAGADLGNGPVSLEYQLRALDAPLFDRKVDARRTVHGADLTASAANLYDAVSQRDLRGFHERYPANSRLVKEDRALAEVIWRAPMAAAAIDHALPFAAPPQRAVLEPLAEFLRSGEPDALRVAQGAWLEAAGPTDFFAGFLDRSADPRGRKALFGAFSGIADRERTAALQPLASKLSRVPEALWLASASGALRPMRSFAVTIGAKSALFLGAAQAAAQAHDARALALLTDPAIAGELSACAPQLAEAFVALREMGRIAQDEPALEEARADAAADLLAADPVPGLDNRCRRLWPQFAAASWLESLASVPDGEQVEDDRARAIQLELWWFTGKGALAERRAGGRRWLAVPDDALFLRAARELLTLLDEIARLGDSARAADLLEHHASRLDPQWRDDVLARFRAAGLPRRIAVIPPLIRAVVVDGRITDAEAVPVTDLDAEILRSWSSL